MKTDTRRKTTRTIEVLLHISVWMLVFIIPQYIFIWQEEEPAHFYLLILKKTGFYVFLFYINYFLLIPFLFYRKRKILYFFTIAVATLLTFAVSELVIENSRPGPGRQRPSHTMENAAQGTNPVVLPGHNENVRHPGGHRPPPRWPLTYNNLITFFLIAGAGLGLRTAQKINETEKRSREAEKERINTELSMLKSQIHPHFFFNTLNNIYALTEVGSPDASKALLRLSRLMRYVIYESDEETTTLSREIEFLKNYIDLMRLRINSKVKLDVHFPTGFDDMQIHPLLFISFIENAFKYGISYNQPAFIEILLNADTQGIDFTCRNSIFKPVEGNNEERTGIGLENVRKRLNMLYPAMHRLEIRQSETEFFVNLKLFPK